MPDDLITLDWTCPQCQAAVPGTAKRCWLCGHAADSPFQSAPAAAKPAPPDQNHVSQEQMLNVSLAVMAVVLVLITCAVWAAEPIYGICLAVVLFPALGITLLSGLIRRLAGTPMSPLRRLLTFIYSTLAMFGLAVVLAAIAVIVLVMTVLSAIVGLFQMCFGVR